jgi:transposase
MKVQDFNRQNTSLNNTSFDLLQYFQQPVSPRQKQYEAVRAVVVDRQPAETVAEQFGYSIGTVYSLLRDAKAGKLELFPRVPKGPHGTRMESEIQQRIVAYRRQGLSCEDIALCLAEDGIHRSARTVERFLKAAGFPKLPRRTNKALGRSVSNTLIAEPARPLNLPALDPFRVDCPTAGVFFFIPYIVESGLLEIVSQAQLPASSRIGATQASLSILLLKLIGGKRLSHISHYDQEPGLGVFAALNRLPKATYMSTYSCRCSETQVLDFQAQLMRRFVQTYPEFYRSEFINLDFHSIPHYGDESAMEKLWCGARGKTMQAANTVFAQDSQSNAILYTRADILRSEEAQEVKKFVSYWKSLHGDLRETLVFDCKFTTYKVLDELAADQVTFITLRKRHATLLAATAAIPQDDWQRVLLPIPKRKYTRMSVYEQPVTLTDCTQTFRQIIIKDHGRSTPTFVITNNDTLTLAQILEVYAKRWHIEQKLAELVAFFNLNALSSPLMVRIHFDMLWTLIADTLYHRFAQDLRRFEQVRAPQLFKKFIDMPGQVVYDGDTFSIKIRKRAHTPILKEVEKLQTPFQVPWLDDKSMQVVWTA